MSSNPRARVSVVIPTFNRERYLEEAVDSVSRQSFTDWELICVDDGSTDGTAELMKSVCADDRIRYVYQPNQGQATARNRGIQESQTDLIAFLDSDNRWHQEKLRVQVDFMDAHSNVDVAYAEGECIDALGRVIGMAPMPRWSGLIWRQLLRDNFIPFNTAMVRKSCLVNVGGLDETVKRGDDYDLWLRLSASCRFHYIPLILSQYRIEGDRISDNLDARLQSNKNAIERFIAANPRLINPAERRSAWSDFYRRCSYNRAQSGARAKALADAAKAIGHRPEAWQNWRMLAYSIYRLVLPHGSRD